MKNRDILIIIGIILASAVAHWGHFNLSPRGVHVWRQCNTLAVAKNYYQESMNIMLPRVDHRKSGNGITGTAFPLYEYGLAISYKLFGFHHINHRLLQFLINCLGVLGIYFMCFHLFRSSLASFLGSVAYAFSPEIFYHSINAIPDILAMTSIIWSCYFYLKSKKQALLLVLSIAFLSIAALVKLQFLLFGVFFFADSIIDKNYSRSVGLGVLGFLSGGLVVNWYIHSILLRYHSNLQDYGLFLNPADSWSKGLEILKLNILSDIPEQLIGYGMIIPLIFAIYLIITKSTTRFKLKAFSLFILFAAFHIQELKQMEHHAYYMMPYVFISAILIAYAVNGGFKAKWLIVLVVIAQIVHSSNKILPRYADENSYLPPEFLDPVALDSLQSACDDSKISVVGPDPSGCIYFYFLDTKGYNIAGMDQLQSKDDVREAIASKKVNCLIIKDLEPHYLDDIATNYPKISTIGSFTVLKP